MNREKRIEALKAMRTILEMVSDEEVFATFDLKIPTSEELEDSLDDKAFSEAMGAFFSMTEKAVSRQGYWCDGLSCFEEGYDESKLQIISARKAPILPDMIMYNELTMWIVSGRFLGIPFIANGTQVVRTDKVVEGDDLLDPRMRYGYPFDITDERMLLRTLAKKLKAGAVEGLTLEEAEAMEASWRKNDWKGEEW